MANAFKLRLAEPHEFGAILSLCRLVAEAGDAFMWDGAISDEELANAWLPDLSRRVETFVAESDDDFQDRTRRLVGVAALSPAAAGRGRHIAQLTLAVHPVARCRGLGKRLCATCIDEAARRGYHGIRADPVVSTNTAAKRMFLACGFNHMGSLPRAFDHPEFGLVDVYALFQHVTPKEVGVPAASDAAAGEDGLQQRQQLLSQDPPRALQYRRRASAGLGGSSGDVAVTVGEEVDLEPRFNGSSCRAVLEGFSTDVPLPTGLQLDPATGAITGAAAHGAPPQAYRITATAVVDLTLQVEEDSAPSEAETLRCSRDDVRQPLCINEEFADQITQINDVRDMLPEPARTRAYGDWMIWMVHRVHLNDATLTKLEFTNMDMPPGHIEKRIAPKLMAAMKTNTHLEELTLSNANMCRAEAPVLAEALRVNTTLLELNLEANRLDSNAVRELALALHANPGTKLEHFRVSHQRQMGQFFGRPTEEAIGQMMERNETITKLGFECDDAHWRHLIDRALLRNNDYWRRRQQSPAEPDDVPPAEEKTLSHVLLQAPPTDAGRALFPEGSDHHAVLRMYLSEISKLPTTSQLQSFAKNMGKPVSYQAAAPLIRECRSSMLDASRGRTVVVIDAFGKHATGVLRDWSEANEHWAIEVWTDEQQRVIFRASKEPGFSISNAWAEWLGSGGKAPSIAGA